MSLKASPMGWQHRKQCGLPVARNMRDKAVAEYRKDVRAWSHVLSLKSANSVELLDLEMEETFAYNFDFNPNGRLIVGQEDGQIMVLDTMEAICEPVQTLGCWRAHSNAIFDIRWFGNNEALSVSGDLFIKRWAVDRSECLASVKLPKVNEYEGCHKCIDVAPNTDQKCVTGGRNNAITYWDFREANPAVLNVVKYSHRPLVKNSSAKASVTDLKFLDDHLIISCSDKDGFIKIWDMRMSYDRYTGIPKCHHAISYPGSSTLKSYSSLALNSVKTKLYASCQDNTIYCFDVGQRSCIKPEKTFTGHANSHRFYTRISLSVDDRYLATGSMDDHAYIFNTGFNSPSTPVGRLSGHRNSVTCVSFSKQRNDPYKLATCADDHELKVWGCDINFSESDESSTGVESKFEMMSTVEDYTSVSEKYVNDFENVKSEPKQTPESPAPKRRRVLHEIKPKFNPYPCISPQKVELSPRKKQPSKLNVTPKKRLEFSPKKGPWQSPTLNLPNLIEDGKSPHSRSAHNELKPKRALDWLSTLSRMKQMDIGSAKKLPRSPKSGRKRTK